MMYKYRDKKLTDKIIKNLQKLGLDLKIMHVCGTHQDTLVKFGLDSMFRDTGIDMREGPGCPVCVTTTREIEEIVQLGRVGKTIAVYGDMLKAPGENDSLATIKAKGGDVRIVYSAEDAVNIAKKNKDKDVVFFGVGFETTTPATAVTLTDNPPENFSVYSVHRLTPAAVLGVAQLGNVKLNGLILPGHVCTITGSVPWEFLEDPLHMPSVIAGFEPLDLLMGVYMIAKQVKEGKGILENEYDRVVKPEGNIKAKEIMEQIFEPEDVEWRGFPVLKDSGLKIRKEYEDYDAEKVFENDLIELKDKEFKDPPGCLCGEVIRGEIYSWECPLFGNKCTPSTPVGPCMVSAEGACAIEYKYGKHKIK